MADFKNNISPIVPADNGNHYFYWLLKDATPIKQGYVWIPKNDVKDMDESTKLAYVNAKVTTDCSADMAGG